MTASRGTASRRLLLVVGSHRSGTSAVTRVLNLLGAQVGGDLGDLIEGVDGDNPRGFWELRDVVDAHEALLRELGSSWRDMRPLPDRWWEGRAGETCGRSLGAILDRQFRDSTLAVVKDPRLCRLLPLWKAIVPATGMTPACVMILRHPSEVATSLHARNAMSRSRAYLLWLDHVLRAEAESRGLDRTFLTFDQLLADWRGSVRRIASELDLDWPRPVDGAALEIEAFLDPRLNRCRGGTGRESDMPAWVAATWHALEEVCRDGESADVRRRLSEIRSQVEAAAEAYTPLLADVEPELAGLTARLSGVLRNLSNVRRSLDATSVELSRSRAEARAANRRVVRLERLHREALSHVDRVAATRSWRWTSRLRALWDSARGAHTFFHELRTFPTRARYTIQSRGTAALILDVGRELGKRLRQGSLAPPRPDAVSLRLSTLDEQTTARVLVFPRVQDPLVSIVIPAFNQFELTHACLASILEHTSEHAIEVVVVDDGSSDETCMLERFVHDVVVLHGEENVGFVHACNRGAVAARGKFLVFLNNDTRVSKGWLGALLEPLAREDVGLVGAKLVYPDGRLQEAGGIVFDDGSAWNYGRGGDPREPRYNYSSDVDYCSGACLAVDRGFFLSLGRFDERYAPAYYEDGDFAFAVREAGKRVVYQPTAEIVHVEGATSGRDTSVGPKRHQVENREKFFAKWEKTLASHPPPGTDPDAARRWAKRSRVLVVDSYTPELDRDAGSVRMFHILRLLVELGCHVRFLPQNLAHAGDHTTMLQSVGVEAVYHPYVSSVADHLKRHGAGYDAIVLSRLEVARETVEIARRHSPQARLIFDTVDVHFLRERRRADLFPEFSAEAERCRRRELEVVRGVDLTLVVSPVEKEILDREVPGASVEILSVIGDPEPTEAPFEARSGILYVANFTHPPNVDGLERYLAEVHPLVRRRLDSVVLTVIGKDPPDRLTRFADDFVRFVGRLPAIQPSFASARLSIAPLRYGAGVKGKVQSSLNFGVPVVTTSIGAEGMALEHGRDVLIADDDESFADAVVRAYTDADLWETLSVNGVRTMREQFSTERATRVLSGILGLDERGSSGG